MRVTADTAVISIYVYCGDAGIKVYPKEWVFKF